MAELPEIETLRHDLEREVAGKRIKSVEFTGMKSLARYQNRKQVAARLEGVKVTAVKRRGLLLLFKLDSNEYLIVDAGEAGHLVRTAAKDPVTPHTRWPSSTSPSSARSSRSSPTTAPTRSTIP